VIVLTQVGINKSLQSDIFLVPIQLIANNEVINFMLRELIVSCIAYLFAVFKVNNYFFCQIS
jgi:hypothetical protein